MVREEELDVPQSLLHAQSREPWVTGFFLLMTYSSLRALVVLPHQSVFRASQGARLQLSVTLPPPCE